jgi:hypothetical protein
MNQIYYQTYFNGKKITIYKFYDLEFKADRYSYSIDENHHSGGYGKNNEIIYPDDKIALLNAISHIADKKDFLRIKREFLINDILSNCK